MFQKKALDTVLPNVLFSLSQIVIHACLPQVIVLLVCQNMGYSDCDDASISAQASIISLLLSFIVNIPGLLIIGFYGSFADKYGLKNTLLIPILGNIIFLASIYQAIITPLYFVHILMFGALISGLSGSRNTFIMASFTYAADFSLPEERSNIFSVIESSIFVAKIIGPFVVGYLSDLYGFSQSLIVGIIICAVNIIVVSFGLKNPAVSMNVPEVFGDENTEKNHTENTENKMTELSFHPLTTFRKVSKLFGNNCLGDPSVPYIASAYFLYYMASMGEVTIEILFQKRMFHFSPETIGLFGSVSGLMQSISMLVMPLLFIRLFKFDLKDIYWIEIGLWSRAIYYFLFSYADNGVQLFYILPILILCGPVVPRTRSYLSKTVGINEQTDLFTAIAALEAVAAFFSPIYTYGYFHTVSIFPGLMFQVIAGICVIAALFIL